MAGKMSHENWHIINKTKAETFIHLAGVLAAVCGWNESHVECLSACLDRGLALTSGEPGIHTAQQLDEGVVS